MAQGRGVPVQEVMEPGRRLEVEDERPGTAYQHARRGVQCRAGSAGGLVLRCALLSLLCFPVQCCCSVTKREGSQPQRATCCAGGNSSHAPVLPLFFDHVHGSAQLGSAWLGR